MADLVKKRLLIGIIGVILVATVIVVALMYNTPADRFSKYLTAGFKYLDEGNYEEAKAQFKKAIDIEPNNVEAYLGISDAYQNQAEEYLNSDDIESFKKEYYELLDILNKGYEITHDDKILDKINEAKKELSEFVDEEEIDAFLLDKSEAGGDGDNANTSNDDDDAIIKNNDFGIDVAGYKVFGLSIYDIASMSSDDLISYARSSFSLPYSYTPEYSTELFIDSSEPMDGSVADGAYVMRLTKYSEADEYVPGTTSLTYSRVTYNGAVYTSNSADVMDPTGQHSIISCPAEAELSKYCTVPDKFPPINGTLDDIIKWLDDRGIEYTNYDSYIVVTFPKELVPKKCSSMTVSFGDRGAGVIYVQFTSKVK